MYIIHGAFMVQKFYTMFCNPGYRDFGADLVQKNAPKWLNHRSALNTF